MIKLPSAKCLFWYNCNFYYWNLLTGFWGNENKYFTHILGPSLLCCTYYNYSAHTERVSNLEGQANHKSWVQFNLSPWESNLICIWIIILLLQLSQESTLPANPSKNVNFKEEQVDKLRAQKDDDFAPKSIWVFDQNWPS